MTPAPFISFRKAARRPCARVRTPRRKTEEQRSQAIDDLHRSANQELHQAGPASNSSPLRTPADMNEKGTEVARSDSIDFEGLQNTCQILGPQDAVQTPQRRRQAPHNFSVHALK